MPSIALLKHISVLFGTQVHFCPLFSQAGRVLTFGQLGVIASIPLLLSFFFCYFESRALCCLVVIVYHRFCKRCADVWEERTQSFVSLSNIVCRCEGIQTLLLLTLFVFPTTNIFCLFVFSTDSFATMDMEMDVILKFHSSMYHSKFQETWYKVSVC